MARWIVIGGAASPIGGRRAPRAGANRIAGAATIRLLKTPPLRPRPVDRLNCDIWGVRRREAGSCRAVIPPAGIASTGNADAGTGDGEPAWLGGTAPTPWEEAAGVVRNAGLGREDRRGADTLEEPLTLEGRLGTEPPRGVTDRNEVNPLAWAAPGTAGVVNRLPRAAAGDGKWPLVSDGTVVAKRGRVLGRDPAEGTVAGGMLAAVARIGAVSGR